MTNENTSTRPLHPVSLTKRMLLGAAIALALITAFLISAGEGDPAWPRFWMVRPLVIVPLAGATGGAFFYFMDHLRHHGGWRAVLGIVLGVIVYIFGLWLGTVLGLDGTYWD
ncbi:hypothetical protein [Chitinophaga sp. YIM B06452]|uniref:hypothetical protein n=1 Tax=Chitinophaga sp. YIM B06452 TaxID=3082158 RepID=UPI0031FE4998